jgi:hypothetical protein
VQTTALPPVQTPAWQVSVCVQAFPSLQLPVLTGLEQVPVAVLQAPTSWHWSLAVHFTGLAPVQVPAWHVSVRVQALPSLHVVPFATVGFEHVPVVGLHVPGPWHWSLAVHVTGFVPAQVPAWQVSVRVQALPSLHVVPFAAGGFEHAPVVGSHAPATWHWSLAPHVTGFEPVQVPPWHMSVWVQRLPSLQDAPSAAGGFEQTPVNGLHAPATWHWSLAAHVTRFEPVHLPAWHESVCVHALPSLHVVPSAADGFEHMPVNGSQTPATWHWSCAAHATVPPPWQIPFWHMSFWVHALPSLHDPPLVGAQVPTDPGTLQAWH